MIYIIDDQVTYNSDDCTLSHIPTQDSLSLSISSGRLFEQLLNSEGEILARDTLLIEVWDKYGLRGSNSNLNQYLSILRRALAAYGCDNLIVTIPKIGIRLNTDIKIVRESAPVIEVAESSAELPAEPVPLATSFNTTEPAATLARAPETTLTYRPVLLAAAIAVLLIGFYWYYTANHFTQRNDSLSTIKLEGGCEAVIVKGGDGVERQLINKQILQMLRENNQSCTAGRRVYFDKNTSFNPTNFGRTIISACNLNARGHVTSCENFYYLDWRMS